ncbi:MAG TPA: 16S rRNA (adenine(1518)-N(6)/adenine(1519)-N(6))-dimethyltransferase RsmA [Candidatus Omnitrophota bacterium]|nr:16S rRNA (adenine(1518)-N(6)/adenine(1519)-N(6))-dimethyltransferase RsmA [Candidatus Omnitrophota bacterium]HQO37841.1 16S rRNA (adenine(1518)-N(6)/adenine(1519)-N(6))-dimethyltransferase RsmA [Candidatus Omnitrophota bacterium]HQQ06608.1 16S rRNA (adenine(1518)-N(6)/adenine(1519)-N(6))-dimethyltransferase RsmA [Candidatus Omnitrophota bacterium]
MRAKPKKSLGQNFLQDPNIRRKIIAACDLSERDTVVEIGPGQGALTELIAPKVKRLIAVEVDRALSAELSGRFQGDPRVTVINADFLKYDLSAVSIPPSHKLKVVGNIPYYITSPIIEHLFSFRNRISAIYLTVQKEFGQRIIAKPGTAHYGAFSCFVQYYAEPKIEFIIKRTCFFPAPAVDSCFLKLTVRPEPPAAVIDETLFFKVIRASFQKRRKTLGNCLKAIVPDGALTALLSGCNIDPRIRGEELGLPEFARISNAFSRYYNIINQ